VLRWLRSVKIIADRKHLHFNDLRQIVLSTPVDFQAKLATSRRVRSDWISFRPRARRRCGVVAYLAVDETREVVHFPFRKLPGP
jgi:hypothetical protein